MSSLPPPGRPEPPSDSGLGDDSQTTARQRRALHIVRDALATDPTGRDSLVLSLCGPDASLRAQVDALLRAVATSDLCTQTSAMPSGQPSGVPEHLFGPFRAIRFLGRGGMAEVWLARRDGRDFQQEVALKLMHPALLRQQRRFRDERQILARLNHPNIAHFIDGGVSDDGRPWLALEHVDGERITDWCDARMLDLRARIKLMLPVCDAVGYAHRNLVVHRDIKPGNLLVTTEGVPKLLDFGIAKLLDQTDPEQTLTLALTPAYASPEQRRGEVVTTASDVFQLGLVLERLLCGIDASPFREEPTAAGAGTEPRRMERAFTALQRADAAGANALAQARSLSPDRLRSLLRGDLGRIVAKATNESPGDRYGSPGELAGDLRRWLDGKPVRASRNSALYRLGRFLRRNRVAMALATVLALSLIVGALGIGWQQRQTSQADQRAVALKDYLVEMLRQADTGSGPAQLSAREILARGAEQLGTLPANDPTRIELLGTLLKLYDDLSLQRDGYELALRELGENPQGSSFSDPASLFALTGRIRLSDSDGRARMVAELPILIAAVNAYPDRSDPMYAYALGQIGERYGDLGQPEQSEHWHRLALELLEKSLPADDSTIATTRTLLAGAITTQRRNSEGRALTEQAIAEISPLDSRERAYVHNMAGLRRALFGDFAGAEALFRETRRIRDLLGDTRLADYYDTTHITNALDLGDFDRARSMLETAIEGARARVSARGMDHVAALIVLQGESALAQDRFAEAASHFRQAVDLYLQDHLGDSHPRGAHAAALETIALALSGDTTQARIAQARIDTLAIRVEPRASHLTAMIQAADAVLAWREERYAESRALFDQALDRLAESQQFPAPVQTQLHEYRDAVRFRDWQAQMLLADDDPAAAKALATQAHVLALSTLGEAHPLTWRMAALMSSL